MSKLILLACSLALASPIYAQSVTETLGIKSALGISPSTQDFVTQVAMSQMLEIESSKVAEERGDDKTKQFAVKMIKDHAESANALKALVQSGNIKVTLPTSLDQDHQSKLDELMGLNGRQFAKAYADLQIETYQYVLSLFTRYSDGGDHPDLKLFAVRQRPQLEEHMRMAKDLRE